MNRVIDPRVPTPLKWPDAERGFDPEDFAAKAVGALDLLWGDLTDPSAYVLVPDPPPRDQNLHDFVASTGLSPRPVGAAGQLWTIEDNADLVRLLPSFFRLGSNLLYLLRVPLEDDDVWPPNVGKLLFAPPHSSIHPRAALLAFDWGELVEAFGPDQVSPHPP